MKVTSMHPSFLPRIFFQLAISGLLCVALFLTSYSVQAQVVNSFQRIGTSAGNFNVILDNLDDFGESLKQIGDVDGDGIVDLAVGTRRDADGGPGRGAVYILFLNRDGTVRRHQKISDLEGGFGGQLRDSDQFGHGVSGIGDLDGDGIPDIVAGTGLADLTSTANTNEGAIWVLFLNRNGTVKRHQKITESVGGFTGNLDVNDRFGNDIESLGDFNNNGSTAIAVAADGDDDGGRNRAAFYILFLNNNGTVIRHQKISQTAGGFTGQLSNFDQFGQSVAMIGDLNNDGTPDLAVGAEGDDDGGVDFGAVWILFMNANATVKSHQKISSITGGFTGQLDIDDEFGQSVSLLGDINNDGIPDLVVGAEFDDDGADKAGAVYVLTLKRNGTVESTQKISGTSENFTRLRRNSEFGQAVTSLGDLNLDGVPDIAVSADAYNDPTRQNGSVFVIFLNGSRSGPVNQAPVIAAIANQTITEGTQLIIPVSASDTDGPPPLALSASGLPAGASFADSGNGAGEFNWTPPAGAALNSPYSVTFRAIDGSNASSIRQVTINVRQAGGNNSGVLTGDMRGANSVVNLTAEGTTDWTHWLGTNNIIRKAGVTPQISDFAVIGGDSPTGAGAESTYVWSNGTPRQSNSNSSGTRVFNVGSGFQITVPADTSSRTLRLYVGAKNARGLLRASLSDGSSPDYSALVNQQSRLGSHVVTLDYQAASAGQTLTVSFVMQTRYKGNLRASQINIESATLTR